MIEIISTYFVIKAIGSLWNSEFISGVVCSVMGVKGGSQFQRMEKKYINTRLRFLRCAAYTRDNMGLPVSILHVHVSVILAQNTLFLFTFGSSKNIMTLKRIASRWAIINSLVLYTPWYVWEGGAKVLNQMQRTGGQSVLKIKWCDYFFQTQYKYAIFWFIWKCWISKLESS